MAELADHGLLEDPLPRKPGYRGADSSLIIVKKKTAKRLRAMRLTKSETYEDVITRLLKSEENKNGTTTQA